MHDTKTQSSAAPTVTVHVIIAKESATMSWNEVVGTVAAVQRTIISAKIAGTITEMPVVLGTTVK